MHEELKPCPFCGGYGDVASVILDNLDALDVIKEIERLITSGDDA